MNALEFDATDAMRKHAVMNVTITGMRRFRVRLFLVRCLVWLMQVVAPMRVEVEIK